MHVSKVLMSELGVLAKFAFICGPILMMFAGWRYYRLEKELGFQEGGLYVFPEVALFGVILGAALIYLFV
jgi:putative membrane protein